MKFCFVIMTKLLPKVSNGFARYPSSPFPVGGDILKSESHKRVFLGQFPLEVAFENSVILGRHPMHNGKIWQYAK